MAMAPNTKSKSLHQPLVPRKLFQHWSRSSKIKSQFLAPVADSLGRISRRECWSLEIAALSGCILVLVTLSITLKKFDGEILAAWSAPITLNAFTSLLVTILYLFLTAVLSKCVHQMRWIHYYNPQPLLDLQRFDLVSSSGFGAIRHLTSITKSVRLSFAAILVLAMTSVGPLTQQIIGIETVDSVSAERAHIPVASHLESPSTNDAGISVFQPSNVLYWKITQAVYAGLLANSNPSEFNVLPQCPSGNCTWDSYASLMVRSSVRNVTDKLEIAGPQKLTEQLQAQSNISTNSNQSTSGSAIFLPGSDLPVPGVSFDFLRSMLQSQFPDIYSDFDGNIPNVSWISSQQNVFSVQPSDTGQLNGGGPLGADSVYQYMHIYLFEIEANISQSSTGSLEIITAQIRKPTAWNCTFQLSLQPMQSRVVNGALTEQAIGSPITYSGPSIEDPAYPLGTFTFNYTWDGSKFGVDPFSIDGIANVVKELLTTNITNGTMNYTWQGLPVPERPTSYGALSVPGSILYSLATGQYQTNSSDRLNDSAQSTRLLGDAMDNVTRIMTTALRSFGGDTAQGNVHRTQAVYAVKWAWVAAPVTIISLASLLVAITVVETRKLGLPTWTDSTLALVVHGVDDYGRMDLAEIRSVEELEQACKGVNVSLNKKKLVLEAT